MELVKSSFVATWSFASCASLSDNRAYLVVSLLGGKSACCKWLKWMNLLLISLVGAFGSTTGANVRQCSKWSGSGEESCRLGLNGDRSVLEGVEEWAKIQTYDVLDGQAGHPFIGCTC
jgi:hypothetical protein